jgi:hypothetical protein
MSKTWLILAPNISALNIPVDIPAQSEPYLPTKTPIMAGQPKSPKRGRWVFKNFELWAFPRKCLC